jgi:hypothetical protein
MNAVEIDCGQNIRDHRLNHVEARIGLNLLASQSGIQAELPRGVHEIFLKNLQGNHARALRSMLQNQLQRSPLL